MSLSQILVSAAAALVIAVLARFFFGTRGSITAEATAGGQEATVVVHGGYTPSVVRARTGTPLRVTFDRRESGDCSSRVVFPDLGINRFLPPLESTTIEVPADRPGSFDFACGMNMIHGTLVIEGEPTIGGGTGGDQATGDRNVDLDAEDVARRAELNDLGRRVVVGAVLTLPVFVAVMAAEVFDATWVPEVLMKQWVQLAMITPVMVWVGLPIHRTGWLAPAHHAADMNSLITLGTLAAYGYSVVATAAPSRLPADARDVYFEAVGGIITLITLGRLLEARAKAGTGEAIKRLVGLQPRIAHIVRNGIVGDVEIGDVEPGDILAGPTGREGTGRR
jgi:Cu+-exporting ATPase